MFAQILEAAAPSRWLFQSMLESVQQVRETYFPVQEIEKNGQWLLLKALLCNPPSSSESKFILLINYPLIVSWFSAFSVSVRITSTWPQLIILFIHQSLVPVEVRANFLLQAIQLSCLFWRSWLIALLVFPVSEHVCLCSRCSDVNVSCFC